ncbi:hypothetical protein M3Y98_00592800 [Aphelenchoides besseyi]|nr:hypothetical protein M3Y98_00592800 [Aphelenchoides besseyi]
MLRARIVHQIQRVADKMQNVNSEGTQNNSPDNSISKVSSTGSLSNLNAFPKRQSSLASTSDKNSNHTSNVQILAPDEIEKRIDKRTRLAFAELLLTVLEVDFCGSDENFNEFKKQTQEFIFKALKLKTEDEKLLFDKVSGNNDLGEVIVVIKNNEYLKEHSPITLLACFLNVALGGGSYDSRHRVLIRHCTAMLGILFDDVEQIGSKYAGEKCQNEKNKTLCARASAGIGGILIGVTGGLAAPLGWFEVILLAAGTGFLIGGTVSGIATTAGAAAIGSLFGIAGAGISGYKMSKRVGAIEEFVIEDLSDGESLHCVLCVSGWIDEGDGEDAFKTQWKHLQMAQEQYTLRYESKYLIELGKAIEYFMSFAVSYAIQHTLMETALAGLMTAIAWPLVLISSAEVINNPWNVCVSRATEVGEQLAEVLLTRAHGRRPITLIGFSLGARVLYHCLLTMSKREHFQGIIQDVVLLGAPVSASTKEWQQISKVVGGRIINGYCETDWLLRFLYRTMSIQFAIAGTAPVIVKGQQKIVNFNLSHIVKGHFDYSKKLTECLKAVGIRTLSASNEPFQKMSSEARAQASTPPPSETEKIIPLTDVDVDLKATLKIAENVGQPFVQKTEEKTTTKSGETEGDEAAIAAKSKKTQGMEITESSNSRADSRLASGQQSPIAFPPEVLSEAAKGVAKKDVEENECFDPCFYMNKIPMRQHLSERRPKTVAQAEQVHENEEFTINVIAKKVAPKRDLLCKLAVCQKSFLGSGAFSDVYRGTVRRKTSSGVDEVVDVAIKKIWPDPSREDRQITLHRRLKHDNLISLLYYYVCLHPTSKLFVYQTLCALAYLETMSIVHRDIKPNFFGKFAC